MQLIMVLGYLGSGKTTFITQALKSNLGKTAIIVNDFGNKDVDGSIIEDKGGVVKKIFDGSIFCTCKSDKFVEAMLEVIKTRPDTIIVEASGLANPYTMLRELELIEKKGNTKLNLNVFCLVDVSNFEKILPICHAITVQVASSDVIILNKTDLVDPSTVVRVEKLVKEITNGLVIKTTNSKIESYFGYPIVEKKLPKLIEDITLQKLLLKVRLCSKKQLDEVCQKINTISNRVKGIVTLDSGNYIYEYIDGKSKVTKTNQEGSYLVVLSCLKASLKESVKDIISEYDFLEIQ